MWYDGLFLSLERERNPEQGEKMSAYMQNRFPFLGIPKPKLKQIEKEYFSLGKKLPLDWGFINRCYDYNAREAQYVALDYLSLYSKKLEKEDFSNLIRLVTTKSWWETVDSLDAMIGIIVLRYPELFPKMVEYSLSDNLWLRRLAIDFQQEYRQETNEDVLRAVIVNNLGSNEFFINKAIGWSLRDYSKTNPNWVRNFLAEYQNGLAKLSMKEASKYL